MVAAEDEWNLAGFEGLQDHIGALYTRGRDFLEVFCMGRAFLFLLGDGDGDVASVLDRVSDGFEARFKSGDTDGGRTHVNPAAGLAKVKRDADDTNLARSDAAVGRASLRHRRKFSVPGSQFSE